MNFHPEVYVALMMICVCKELILSCIVCIRIYYLLVMVSFSSSSFMSVKAVTVTYLHANVLSCILQPMVTLQKIIINLYTGSNSITPERAKSPCTIFLYKQLLYYNIYLPNKQFLSHPRFSCSFLMQSTYDYLLNCQKRGRKPDQPIFF